MSDPVYNVLFVCTGNSARSILAEAIMNHLGRRNFRTYREISQRLRIFLNLPLDKIDRMALEQQLTEIGNQ